ncbi:MAG: helix-turn-helix transcriptional regulator [Candidatus Eisenbacteria bacterium]
MTDTPPQRRYLRAREVAARIRVSAATLRRWRATEHAGPDWSRIGGRILYRSDWLEEWEAKRIRRAAPRA